MVAMDNPIITRELRTRLRGNRAAWTLAVYIGFLSLLMMCGYWQATQIEDGIADGRLGEALFAFLRAGQGVLLCFLVPGLAAGAISTEVEQQTLDGLYASALSTRRLFWGKMVASMLFVGQLLTASLPLMALTFLLGGVSLQQILGTYAVQMSAALILAGIGVGCSLHSRTSSAAAGVACLLSLIYLGFTGAFCQIGPLRAISPVAFYGAEQLATWLDYLRAVGANAAVAFVLLDFSVCRARLMRDGVVSIRPRLWLLAIVAGLVALMIWPASQTGATDAIISATIIGIGLALLLISGDDGVEASSRVTWWQALRHMPASAPLFVLAVTAAALTVVALGLAATAHWANAVTGWLMVAATVCVASALHVAAGRVWPARMMAVTAVIVTIIVGTSGLDSTHDPFHNLFGPAVAVFCVGVCLLMLYLVNRRRLFGPR